MTAKLTGDLLDGVAATALWTLRNRALESRHPRSAFSDPWSEKLFDAIEYDYERFGAPSQSHALRATSLDRQIRDFLPHRQRVTVVALAEGLQSTYWRLGCPDVDWLAIDTAEVLGLRKQVLPAADRMKSLPMSAFDRSWMDEVDPTSDVFISAEGLFMYCEEDDVRGLVAQCAARFPGAWMFFDSIPRWFSRKTLKGLKLSASYTAPPMPFSLTVGETLRLDREIPGVAEAKDLRLPHGRGIFALKPLHALFDVPPLRDIRPAITLLRFAPA